MTTRYPCAILGASGLVAQRLQQRLTSHPWFTLCAVVGSSESAGSNLSDLPWRLEESRPTLPNIVVLDSDDPNLISQLQNEKVQFIFSAVPNSVASVLEVELAEAGFHVFSNAAYHRCTDGIPLIVADLNPHHLLHYKMQEWSGSLACSTNCTVIPIAMPLKPLWDMVGFKHVSITTEQALSGAGWRLLSSQEARDGNVDPNIEGEAEKITEELLHLFGRVTPTGVQPAGFSIAITCNRVAQIDGHLVHVEVHLSRPVDLTEIKEWLQAQSDRPQHLGLPSAPVTSLTIIDECPTRDEHLWMGAKFEPATGTNVDPGNDLTAGMGVTVGALELIDSTTLRFSALSHNTIRGAAGGCVMLAELALAEDVLKI